MRRLETDPADERRRDEAVSAEAAHSGPLARRDLASIGTDVRDWPSDREGVQVGVGSGYV